MESSKCEVSENSSNLSNGRRDMGKKACVPPNEVPLVTDRLHPSRVALHSHVVHGCKVRRVKFHENLSNGS